MSGAGGMGMKKGGSPNADPKPNPPRPVPMQVQIQTCLHDFVFLREVNRGQGSVRVMYDQFYCRRCLEKREQDR